MYSCMTTEFIEYSQISRTSKEWEGWATEVFSSWDAIFSQMGEIP